MQTVNATYTALLSAGAKREVRVTIGSTVYGESKIVSCSTDSPLFTTFGIGNALSSQIDLVIYNPGSIARMAQMELELRLVGSTSSAWLPQGTYFIDTRSYDAESDQLTIHGYDAMLKAEAALIVDEDADEWPKTDSAVVALICTKMGVTLDSRTTLSGTYLVDFPGDLSMREILRHIAAANGGNWIITAAGKLRLVPLTGTGDATALGQGMAELSTAPALPGISKVTLYYDDESSYTAGSDTGYAIEADCPWATQAIVNALLTSLSGYVYRPWTATDALLDPAAELGDAAVINSVSYPIISVARTYDSLSAAVVKAEHEQEVDHEYPYQSKTERQLRRTVKLGQSYYGTTVSRSKGLEIVKTNGVTEQAKVTLNADEMVFEDGDGNPVLYFDAEKGTFVFDGLLGASAIYTDSLYAEQGDVADLTVNRLDTGNYISRYLTRNISDLNHIQITTDSYGLPHIYLMTSKVQKAYASADGYERLTNSSGAELYWTDELMTATTDEETEYPAYIAVTAMTNPYGEAVYWSQDISGATITDGYPYVDGVRVYTTTEDTGYPVMVWDYDSQAKVDLTFVMGSSGFYEPRIILGSGDNYGTSKGYIYKGQSGLDIVYDRSDAAGELALRLNDSGGIQKSLTTNGQTVQGTVAGMLIFENLYIGTSDWTLESPATFATYPYAATLTCTGANASMGGEVIFDPDDISTGSLATAAQSGTNTVTIYASEPMAVTVLRVELRF